MNEAQAIRLNDQRRNIKLIRKANKSIQATMKRIAILRKGLNGKEVE